MSRKIGLGRFALLPAGAGSGGGAWSVAGPVRASEDIATTLRRALGRHHAATPAPRLDWAPGSAPLR